jgi:hypothetical protein
MDRNVCMYDIVQAGIEPASVGSSRNARGAGPFGFRQQRTCRPKCTTLCVRTQIEGWGSEGGGSVSKCDFARCSVTRRVARPNREDAGEKSCLGARSPDWRNIALRARAPEQGRALLSCAARTNGSQANLIGLASHHHHWRDGVRKYIHIHAPTYILQAHIHTTGAPWVK